MWNVSWKVYLGIVYFFMLVGVAIKQSNHNFDPDIVYKCMHGYCDSPLATTIVYVQC